MLYIIDIENIVKFLNFNPLMGTGNYSATSGILAVDGWAVTWYNDEGTGRGRSPSRPLIAVQNLTAHPSTASEPISAV